MDELLRPKDELGCSKQGYLRSGYYQTESCIHGSYSESERAGLVEHWRILCRYKFSIISITFLGAVAGVLLTLGQTPLYQARAALEIQNINEDFLNIKQVTPVSAGENSPFGSEIQTQIRLLQSEDLIKRVVAKLKDRDEFGSAEEVARGVKIRSAGQTRVIEISYDSPEPRFAAVLVNTLVQEFIESTMEARLQGSEYTSKWLSSQLEDMRIKLQRSEDALQSYARRAGLIFTSEKTNISEEKLRQLQGELSKTEADRIAAQSRWETVRTGSSDVLSDVPNESSLRSLQEKITELRRREAELITTYTERHTKVKEVEAQIAPLEAALEKEKLGMIARLRNDYEVARGREKLLNAAYASQLGLVTDQAEKSIQYGILKREVDSNREIYAAMMQRVKDASIASAVRASNVRIIDRAEPPKRPYKPSLPINGALGLFSGLCIGAAGAIMRGRADRTLQAPGEARLWLNVPELQVIPAVPREFRHSLNAKGKSSKTKTLGLSTQPRLSAELVTWHLKPSLIGESFRSLLTSILFTSYNGDYPRVLVLTSPGPGEGKTIVASNLGVALARIRRKVLIIDGDLRKPRIHELFGIQNDRGFSSLLCHPRLSDAQLKDIVEETSIPGLSVLTSGPAIESAADLLYCVDLSRLLAEFKTEFDFIIIDTPPMSQLPDARVLGRLADAVILITRAGHTTRKAAEDAYRRLTEDKAQVLGTVLNDWNPKNASGYSYGYKYPA